MSAQQSSDPAALIMPDRTVHEDPLTGQRFRTLKTGDETGGQLLQTELWIAAGGQIPAHVHPHQEERFELVTGRLRFTIAGQERVAHVGDVIVVPAGTAQGARNESAEEARLIIEVRPALDLQQALETLAALARSGRLTRRFVPKTPAALLQLSVVADGYRNTVYAASPPLVVQRLLLSPLAALGRRLGYRKDAPLLTTPEPNDPRPSEVEVVAERVEFVDAPFEEQVDTAVDACPDNVPAQPAVYAIGRSQK